MQDTRSLRPTIIAGAALLIAGIIAYAGTMQNVASMWMRIPDYSHGVLVVPIAIFLLWARRDQLRKIDIQPSYWGFIPLAIGFLFKYLGYYYYLDPFDHVSILFWVAGVVWLLGGGKFFAWAAPAVVFLAFMFPMPFSMETMFSMPMQRVATSASCWLLQSLGQPAFANGNVITIGDQKIEVVQACSGLRMLLGFLAICTAYAILAIRPMWERILIVLASFPIAIVSNVLRITITGLLDRYASAYMAHKFNDELAGYFMMPMALGFLVLGLWYLDRLFVEAEVADSAITGPRVQTSS